MTLSEFKAWFEGFTESMEGAPTADQFAKIKAKVEKIDGAPVTYPIYVERYWPMLGQPIRNWWGDPIYAGNIGYATGGVGSDAVGGSYAYIDPASKGDNQTITFDSHAAMRDLGRAEAA